MLVDLKIRCKHCSCKSTSRSKQSIKDKFKGVTKIGDGDVEKVAKEKPDLIIVYSTDKDIKNIKSSTNSSC